MILRRVDIDKLLVSESLVQNRGKGTKWYQEFRVDSRVRLKVRNYLSWRWAGLRGICSNRGAHV